MAKKCGKRVRTDIVKQVITEAWSGFIVVYRKPLQEVLEKETLFHANSKETISVSDG